MAAGDLATARATVRFLFERQQLADGRFPRNSLVNGKQAPDTGGDQLDETAYPILMAYQAGLQDDGDLWSDHVRKAADFVVAHGPSFGSERWEEQGGYSPSTIAAEIAGLVAAGRIADVNGDHAASAGLPGHRRPLPAQHQGLDGHHHRPLRHRPLLHPAVQERRPERGGHLQPRQRRPRRRPAGGHRRRVPRADPARHPARPTTPTCSGRCPSWTTVIRRDTDSGPGLLPLRHRRRRAPRTGTATATSPTPPTARPPASRGRTRQRLRARVAGAERRARRAAPADRRRGDGAPAAARHAAVRVRHRAGPRAGLGEPGPAGVPVRHQPRDRVHRVRERRRGRLRLPADLGAGPAGAAHPEHRDGRGRSSSRGSCASATSRRRRPRRRSRSRRRPTAPR